MAKIWSMPVTKVIDYRYSKLVFNFPIYSDVLGQLSVIPAGFVMDWESIWRIKGSGMANIGRFAAQLDISTNTMF